MLLALVTGAASARAQDAAEAEDLCREAAGFSRVGAFMHQPTPEAEQVCKKAWRSGVSANAGAYLGRAYYRSERHEEARSVIEQAAARGSALAEVLLGILHENGYSFPKDEARAVHYYEQGAVRGVAAAQYKLAQMLNDGKGIKKDENKALSLYRKAAAQGHANAQDALGDRYLNGKGVKRDDAQAVALYRAAAIQGLDDAQFSLGWMYEQGRGVQKDEVQAVLWYRKAAGQGDADAQLQLGLMYDQGRGVQKDAVQAVLWYRKAADQGNVSAKHNLAMVYAEGSMPGGVDLLQASALWRASGLERSRLELLMRRPVAEALAELRAWQVADFKAGTMASVRYFLNARLPGIALDTAVHAIETDAFKALPSDARSELLDELREELESACRLTDAGETEVSLLMRLDAFGIAHAAYQLGAIYGRMGKEREAFQWGMKAARAGLPNAQVSVGWKYQHGEGVEPDAKQAVLWYRKAAEQDDAYGQLNLGNMYSRGLGVPKDDAQSFAWTAKAAAQGDEVALYNLGILYEDGLGVSRDLAEAAKAYRQSAEKGYVKAQAVLGRLYRDGVGLEQDDIQSVLWLRKAAEAGDAESQLMLGWMYGEGKGVPKDAVLAAAWYRKAADQGHLDAQFNLGVVHLVGQGVAKDLATAASWFRQAAEQGHKESQHNLGWAYTRGEGVQKDEAQALLWFRKAADQGDPSAQTRLGFLYAEGTGGVKRDETEAVTWYTKAAEQGVLEAKRGLDRLRPRTEEFGHSPDTRPTASGVADHLPSTEAPAVKQARLPEAAPQQQGSPSAVSEGTSKPKRLMPVAGRTDLEIEQLQSVVAAEIERQRWNRAADALDSMADWQLAADRVDDALASRIQAVAARDAYTAALFGSEDNYFRLLSSSCSWSEVARFALRVDRREAALATAKLAVNRLQQARRQIGTLGDSLRECFLKVHEDRYRWLADLMVSMGRLGEAEQVLGMLKSFEAEEYVRRGDAPSASATVELSLDAAQRKLMESANRLTDQAQAATLLGRLRAKAREGPLSADEQAQLKQAQQVLQGAQLQFNAARDSLLADLKALRQNPAEKTGAESQEAAVAASASIRGTLRTVFKGRAVVVHSVVLPHRTHLLITTADTQQVVQVEVSRDDLSRKVSAFRQAIQSGKSDPQPMARELYRLLIEPILPLIRTHGVDTLMISADGVLRYLPFAALHDGKEYLIEQFAVTGYSPLTRDLLVAKPQRPSWRLAGFGVSHAQGEFPALPNVPAELKAIVRQNGERDGAVPGQRYVDEQFTSQALSEALASDVPALHIASHFRLRHGDRKNSGLLLGKGGLLTLEDLANDHVGFDLSGVELLTLSACETAVPIGDYAPAASGSELESLAKLAHESGASAVLATLWPVADRSTARLMATMYRHLAEHPEWTKAEALRRAQIDFIQQRDVSAADIQAMRMAIRPGASPSVQLLGPGHPYFWAPFTLLGNWL